MERSFGSQSKGVAGASDRFRGAEQIALGRGPRHVREHVGGKLPEGGIGLGNGAHKAAGPFGEVACLIGVQAQILIVEALIAMAADAAFDAIEFAGAGSVSALRQGIGFEDQA